MVSKENEIIVGRIVGPWGLRGDIKVHSLTDIPSRFSPGSILQIGIQSVRVERSRSNKNTLIVKLDTINNRTEAEEIRGLPLTIPKQEIKSLPKGAYYHFQIIGIDVWNDQGKYLGKVNEIIPTGNNDVYVIKNEENKDMLIPAIKSVVLDVDTQNKKMRVEIPEGLRWA